MKKLLAGGLARIFQMAPAFRHEPASPLHQPEFMILEWYRTHATAEDLMHDVEELVGAVGVEGIEVARPWPRFRVPDLFLEYADCRLASANLFADCDRLAIRTDPTDTWDDLYFRIWLERIEPKLPKDRAFFVTHYPASQAALARLEQEPDGTFWARRFEAYVGSVELANAFEELTDPIEQRRRFEADQALRRRLHPDWPLSPIDEEFLAALEEGLPPCAGIALGVDRLVMLTANEPDIRYTTWLPYR